jgi:hypothetical protein
MRSSGRGSRGEDTPAADARCETVRLTIDWREKAVVSRLDDAASRPLVACTSSGSRISGFLADAGEEAREVLKRTRYLIRRHIRAAEEPSCSREMGAFICGG